MNGFFKRRIRFFFYQLFYLALLTFGMSNQVNAKNLVYENNWAYLADTVMGGVSQGGAEFSAGALRLTGQASTGSVGSLTIADVMGLTGVSATASVGSIDPKDQVMGLTGQAATVSVGVVNVKAYADIDTGSNTSYSDISTGSNTSYSDVATGSNTSYNDVTGEAA